MIDDPLSMLKGLVAVAPTLNLRVALVSLINFLDRKPGDPQPSTLEVLDVIAQTLVQGHHNVWGDTAARVFDFGDKRGNNVSEVDIAEFKRILGLIPEVDDEGENNG